MNSHKIQGASYLDTPCERCGSKKRISRKWKEKVETFNGFIVVQHQQIVCTNKACQAVFDTNLAKENKKRDELRVQKEESDKRRKENSLIEAAKTRKINADKKKK